MGKSSASGQGVGAVMDSYRKQQESRHRKKNQLTKKNEKDKRKLLSNAVALRQKIKELSANVDDPESHKLRMELEASLERLDSARKARQERLEAAVAAVPRKRMRLESSGPRTAIKLAHGFVFPTAPARHNDGEVPQRRRVFPPTSPESDDDNTFTPVLPPPPSTGKQKKRNGSKGLKNTFIPPPPPPMRKREAQPKTVPFIPPPPPPQMKRADHVEASVPFIPPPPPLLAKKVVGSETTSVPFIPPPPPTKKTVHSEATAPLIPPLPSSKDHTGNVPSSGLHKPSPTTSTTSHETPVVAQSHGLKTLMSRRINAAPDPDNPRREFTGKIKDSGPATKHKALPGDRLSNKSNLNALSTDLKGLVPSSVRLRNLVPSSVRVRNLTVKEEPSQRVSRHSIQQSELAKADSDIDEFLRQVEHIDK